MHCPRCTTPLYPDTLEPGLPASVCRACHGRLVSLAAYRHWRGRGGDADTPAAEPALAEDAPRALTCPKCARLMRKFAMVDGRQLDLCRQCEELWLDGGEWERLKAADLHRQLLTLFSDEWQSAARRSAWAKHAQTAWRERIGDDFDRVCEIAAWIDSHPQQVAIRTYLSRRRDE